jgi:ABC-2 type transport system ATP-binding protein
MIRCDRATVARAGVVVVEGLSLAIEPGQALAVVGRTGAGKSSLLLAAATALPLHAGDIAVEGFSVRREPRQVRQRIGYVPDRPPDWPGVRAGVFLVLFAATAGLAGPRLRAAVERGLDLAGLALRGRTPLDALPAGEAKRLLLARALIHDPPVLLLDDPFTGLDPAEADGVARLIADAQLVGRTVVAAIDSAAVPACFTHLAVLREGRLVATGPAEPASFAAGRRWRHRIECPGAAPAAARALAARGIEATASDPSALIVVHDPARGPFADLLASLVADGIPVESATFDPPWPAQLLAEPG